MSIVSIWKGWWSDNFALQCKKHGRMIHVEHSGQSTNTEFWVFRNQSYLHKQSICIGYFLRGRTPTIRILSSLSTIKGLLTFGSPSTISRLISTIVIAAIQSISGWAWTHMSNERREVVQPFITHCDATPSVVWVVIVRRICTATLGIVPTKIFRPNLPINAVTMARIFHGPILTVGEIP